MAELEAHFTHKIAQPPRSLGTKLVQTGYFTAKARPGLFSADPALIVFSWKKESVLLTFQGPKDASWDFAKVAAREGAKVSTGADGQRIAVVPVSGQTPIQGFVDFGDWVLEVDVGVQAGGPGSNLSFADAERFVTSMTLR